MRRLMPEPKRSRVRGGGDWVRTAMIGFAWALAFCASAHPIAGAAELAVIVNPDSGVSELTPAQVINIFFGRQRRLPSGRAALPVDLAGQDGEKALFYRSLTNKSLAEVRSYWARLVFSGQGSTPRQVQNAEEVLEIVEDNRGAIGYVPSENVDERVRVVFVVEG